MIILVRVRKRVLQEDQDDSVAIVWCVSILHTMYFYKVRNAFFTRRFNFENSMFCIDMIWYLRIGYLIGMMHIYQIDNKLLQLILFCFTL